MTGNTSAGNVSWYNIVMTHALVVTVGAKAVQCFASPLSKACLHCILHALVSCDSSLNKADEILGRNQHFSLASP